MTALIDARTLPIRSERRRETDAGRLPARRGHRQAGRVPADSNYAVVATLRSDGSPHQTVGWVDCDGRHVLVNTSSERTKAEHLCDDPRVSVLTIDRNDPYRWVSIAGTAELTGEGAREHVNALAHRSRGRDYEFRPGEERVLVRITPEHATAYEV